jgi:replicative DNA helicase
MAIQTFKEASDEFLAQTMDMTIAPEKYTGYQSHVAEFNQIFGGYGKNWYVLVGGPQKSGKTAFAASSIAHFAKFGPKVDAVSAEMSNMQYAARLFSIVSGITMNQFRDIDINGPDWTALHEAGQIIGGFQGHLDDESAYIEDIVEGVRERQPDILIIDYVQLLSSRERHASRVSELAHISRTIKRDICQAENVLVLALLQMNQENAKIKNWNTPYAFHGSAAFKNDCDLGFVIAPYYDTEGDESPIYRNAHLVASRHSELETVRLAFLGNRSLMGSSIPELPEYEEQLQDRYGPPPDDDLGILEGTFIDA